MLPLNVMHIFDGHKLELLIKGVIEINMDD